MTWERSEYQKPRMTRIARIGESGLATSSASITNDSPRRAGYRCTENDEATSTSAFGNRELARWSLFQLDDPQGPSRTVRLSFGLFLFFLDFAIRSFYTSFFTADHAA